jgi:hypothetical protein
MGNPVKLVIDETESVCLLAFSAILSLTSALTRNLTEPWDYMDRTYFGRSGSERPLIFKVKRRKVEQEEYPTLYNG